MDNEANHDRAWAEFFGNMTDTEVSAHVARRSRACAMSFEVGQRVSADGYEGIVCDVLSGGVINIRIEGGFLDVAAHKVTRIDPLVDFAQIAVGARFSFEGHTWTKTEEDANGWNARIYERWGQFEAGEMVWAER